MIDPARCPGAAGQTAVRSPTTPAAQAGVARRPGRALNHADACPRTTKSAASQARIAEGTGFQLVGTGGHPSKFLSRLLRIASRVQGPQLYLNMITDSPETPLLSQNLALQTAAFIPDTPRMPGSRDVRF